MKGRWKKRHAWYKRCRKESLLLLCLLLVLATGAAGFGLTKEKFQKLLKTSTREVRKENLGAGVMEMNPLKKEENSDISLVVEEHYNAEEEKQDFVEAYEDIEVYTKLGRYKDTYVVFAGYAMKIKDVYTKVPGLESLYVEKDETDGSYHICDTMDDKTKDLIRKVTGHEDVQTLLKDTEAEYKKALQSDAILQEALTDLQNAYGDSQNK